MNNNMSMKSFNTHTDYNIKYKGKYGIARLVGLDSKAIDATFRVSLNDGYIFYAKLKELVFLDDIKSKERK